MNTHEAIAAIEQGKLVVVEPDEYYAQVRQGLQEKAGRWIDQGQAIYAQIALMEVKRLDDLYGPPPALRAELDKLPTE